MVADKTNSDCGFALDHLPQVVVIIQNFIAKDATNFLRVGVDYRTPARSYVRQTMDFVGVVLSINNPNLPGPQLIEYFGDKDAIMVMKVYI
jgi:hypothetical protein